jgi:hypothetical protein
MPGVTASTPDASAEGWNLVTKEICEPKCLSQDRMLHSIAYIHKEKMATNIVILSMEVRVVTNVRRLGPNDQLWNWLMTFLRFNCFLLNSSWCLNSDESCLPAFYIHSLGTIMLQGVWI